MKSSIKNISYRRYQVPSTLLNSSKGNIEIKPEVFCGLLLLDFKGLMILFLHNTILISKIYGH